MKFCMILVPSFFPSWARRTIFFDCLVDRPDMTIAVSNCMVTGGPLLVTNWEDILVGVVTPLGSVKISKSPLPPSAGGRDPQLRLNDL